MLNLRCALVTLFVSAANAVTVAGCDRAGEPPRRDDSVTPIGPMSVPVDSPVRAVASGWEPRAGPVLLVAGERLDAAIVVFPEVQGEHAAVELRFDTTALRGTAATLINRAGLAGSAMLGERTAPDEDEDCVGWPMLRVGFPSGGPASWTIGLVQSRLVPVPLDSVESLSPSDSAALVAEVARLASTLPVGTTAGQLRGLPFSVQDVQRFHVSPDVDALVAHVVRRIHQEANPLEERTLLIAERDSIQQIGQRRRRYVLAFHQRAVGREETLEGSEVLAAVTPRDIPRPILVVARELEGGVRYVLLERIGIRSWRVKWTSALVRC